LPEGDIHIGKAGGNPEPRIKLSGVGVLANHAYFNIAKSGHIKLCCKEEAADATQINGVYLNKCPKEGELYAAPLTHMDRIVIGLGKMFIFKYPLQVAMKKKIVEEISAANPDMDDEHI